MATEPIDIEVRRRGDEEAARGIEKIGDAAQKTGAKLDVMAQASSILTGYLQKMVAAFAVERIISYGEQYDRLQAKLRTFTSSLEERASVEARLDDIGDRTRTGLSDTVSIYASLNRIVKDQNIRGVDLYKTTELLAKAFTASNSASEDAGAALKQFTYQLGTGELAGRGLRSVLMEFPALGKAIAAGIGVSVAQLNDLASKGFLTTETVFQALARGAGVIDKAFANAPLSVGKAFGELQEQIGLFFGRLSSGASISQQAARLIYDIAKNFDIFGRSVITAMEAFAIYKGYVLGTWLVTYTLQLAGATAATGAFAIAQGVATGSMILLRSTAVSLWAMLAAHPFVAIATALAALVLIIVNFGDKLQLTADGTITAYSAMAGIFRTVIGVLTTMVTMLANTTAGANLLKFAVAALTAGMIYLVATQVSVWLYNAATAAWALSAPIALITLKVIALAAAFAGLMIVINTMIFGWKDTQIQIQTLSDMISNTVNNTLIQLRSQLETNTQAAGQTKSAIDQLTQSMGGAAGAAGALGGGGGGALGGAASGLKELGGAAGGATNALTRTYTTIDYYGKKTQVTAQYSRDLNGNLKELGATVHQVAGENETLTKYVADANGNLVIQSQTITEVNGNMKTTIEMQRDWNGQMVITNKTIEQNNAATNKLKQSTESYIDTLNRAIAAESRRHGITSSGNSYGSSIGGGAVISENTGLPLSEYDSWNYNPFSTFDPKQWEKGYAGGGAFIVGGSGGTDSQRVSFMATPGEVVTIQTPQQVRDAAAPQRGGTAAPITPVQSGGGGGGNVVNATFNLYGVQDFDSYQRNQSQILGGVTQSIQRALYQLGR